MRPPTLLERIKFAIFGHGPDVFFVYYITFIVALMGIGAWGATR